MIDYKVRCDNQKLSNPFAPISSPSISTFSVVPVSVLAPKSDSKPTVPISLAFELSIGLSAIHIKDLIDVKNIVSINPKISNMTP